MFEPGSRMPRRTGCIEYSQVRINSKAAGGWAVLFVKYGYDGCMGVKLGHSH
jgi:hypothetical protein